VLKLRSSLAGKFTVCISLVLLGTVSLFAYITIEALKGVFVQEAQDDVETLTEIILRTTHLQMLQGNQAVVFRMMDDVSKHEKIARIRMFDESGLLRYSTHPNEIGHVLGQSTSECERCHCPEIADTFPTLQSGRRLLTEAVREVEGAASGVARHLVEASNCWGDKRPWEDDATIVVPPRRGRTPLGRGAVWTNRATSSMCNCPSGETRKTVWKPSTPTRRSGSRSRARAFSVAQRRSARAHTPVGSSSLWRPGAYRSKARAERTSSCRRRLTGRSGTSPVRFSQRSDSSARETTSSG